MPNLNTVTYQSLQKFHRDVMHLLTKLLMICDSIRYSELVCDYPGYGNDVAKIDPQPLMDLHATCLEKLQHLLSELKASQEFLAWLTPAEPLPFTRKLWEYRASNLATRFLLNLGDRPRGRHEIALEISTGCLDELHSSAGDPHEAAWAAASRSEVLTFAGGSVGQWRMHLRAEKALARDPDASLTKEEKRQKFAFEAWEVGQGHEEINAVFKLNPLWESYDVGSERSVRRPIEAWAKRIGVKPRKGKRARAVSKK